MNSNELTPEEFVELDELLASVEEKFDSMDLSEADGYLTALQLLPKAPQTREWISFILSTNGKAGTTGNPDKDKRLVNLLIKRFKNIGETIQNSQVIDPVVFDDEGEDVKALEPFALGFLEASQKWPSFLESDNPKISEALIGIFRHLPEEALGDMKKTKEELDKSVPLNTLTEALSDVASCVAQLALESKGIPIPELAKLDEEEPPKKGSKR